MAHEPVRGKANSFCRLLEQRLHFSPLQDNPIGPHFICVLLHEPGGPSSLHPCQCLDQAQISPKPNWSVLVFLNCMVTSLASLASTTSVSLVKRMLMPLRTMSSSTPLRSQYFAASGKAGLFPSNG